MSKESKKDKGRIPDDNLQNLHRFTCINEEQKEFQNSIIENEITICSGPAGTGKTYCALGTAFSLLGNKYKKIVIAKSVQVIPGEEIGFIPGDVRNKMEPFIVSYTGNIDKLFNKKGVANDFIKKGLIEILPLTYIRGVTQDNCIVIMDETQNIVPSTFKSIITRIGHNCKFIFLGDTEQIDIKKEKTSCFSKVIEVFKDDSNISVVTLNDSSVRNPIISGILEKLRENNL